MDNNVKPFI